MSLSVQESKNLEITMYPQVGTNSRKIPNVLLYTFNYTLSQNYNICIFQISHTIGYVLILEDKTKVQ